jgi:hypothetical protein
MLKKYIIIINILYAAIGSAKNCKNTRIDLGINCVTSEKIIICSPNGKPVEVKIFLGKF